MIMLLKAISKKPIIGKLILLVVSTIFSFLASEFFLRNYIDNFQSEKKFDSFDSLQLNEEVSAERHDDVYELYASNSEQFEVITIGDSYTNGGNVQWSQTYPYQLFTELNKKVSITNMGICEDTTKGTYLRLEDYFKRKKIESNHKKTIIVLLVGAADAFFDEGFDFEKVYKKIIDNKEIPTEVIPVKIYKENSFYNNIKTIKMFKFLYIKISQYFDRLIAVDSKIQAKEEVDRCLKLIGGERNSCLESYFTILKAKFMDSEEKQLEAGAEKRSYHNLVQYLIRENQNQTEATEKIVSDLIILVKKMPKALILPEVIYNLITYSTLQSRFEMKDILDVLNHSFREELLYIKSKSELQLDNAEKIIQALERWVPIYQKTELMQNHYYEKIIKLVKENQSHIILMSYPRPYKKINTLIRKIAFENKLPFIDLEKVFENKIEKGDKINDLIGDWEHCTPYGYKVMANSLSIEIKQLLLNQ